MANIERLFRGNDSSFPRDLIMSSIWAENYIPQLRNFMDVCQVTRMSRPILRSKKPIMSLKILFYYLLRKLLGLCFLKNNK